jgi:hypothetical protein
MIELTRRPAAVVYGRVAGVYDWYTAPLEALGGRRARQRMLAHAHGRVLELGIGTGFNLAHYPPAVERSIGGESVRRTKVRTPRRRNGPRMMAGTTPIPSSRPMRRGCSYSCASPRRLTSARPAARRLFTQSEFVPYSTPKTRPSFVPNASTGVA